MYKRFSDFYDKLVFDIDYGKYSDNIFHILFSKGILKGDILEIGCGTGNLTRKLAEKDFSILAFDNSLEMLNIAFPKLIDYENVNLIKADMYSFPYGDYEFDAVVSLLDVINYIRDEKKLKKLFKSTYEGLKSGGLFIFDLNSKNKLLDVLGNNTYVYERDNIFYTWENNLEENLVYFTLNFFEKNDDGTYDRACEFQVERYYPIEYIVQTLKEVGFKNISYTDEDGGAYKETSQRILFSAEK